jgi:anti-sigma B factor antagonist
MTIVSKHQNDVCILELEGDIDANTAPEISSDVLTTTKSEQKILLDLTNVPYMSSAGLRMLLKLYRTVTNEGKKLVLVGLSEDIQDTMEVTGFLQFFTVCPTTEEALSSLS